MNAFTHQKAPESVVFAVSVILAQSIPFHPKLLQSHINDLYGRCRTMEPASLWLLRAALLVANR